MQISTAHEKKVLTFPLVMVNSGFPFDRRLASPSLRPGVFIYSDGPIHGPLFIIFRTAPYQRSIRNLRAPPGKQDQMLGESMQSAALMAFGLVGVIRTKFCFT